MFQIQNVADFWRQKQQNQKSASLNREDSDFSIFTQQKTWRYLSFLTSWHWACANINCTAVLLFLHLVIIILIISSFTQIFKVLSVFSKLLSTFSMPTTPIQMSYINLGTDVSDQMIEAQMSYKERVQIKTLRDMTGYSIGQIQRVVGKSRTTIFNVCATPATPRKRQAINGVLNTPIKHRIVEFIEFFSEGRRMRWSEIIHHLGLICSSDTLARFLRDLGFRRYRAVSKSWLTDKQKMDRLDWALEHQSWDLTDWQRVIWTDESAIHVGDSQHIFVTRQTGKNRMISDCLRSKFQRPYYCMIWGVITTGQKGPLVIWDKTANENIISIGFVEHILSVSFISHLQLHD